MKTRLPSYFCRGCVLVGLGLTMLTTGMAGENAGRVRVVRLPGEIKVIKAQVGTDSVIHVLADADSGPQYLKSLDGANTFTGPLTVVRGPSKSSDLKYQAEDLAIGKGGKVHVALSSDAWKLKLPQEEWGLYYATLEPGAKAFAELRNLNRKPSEGFSIAADEHGNVTASFLSGKLYTMVSHDGGSSFTEYAEPNPEWNPCDCCTTSSAFGGDGKLALLYREETKNLRDMYVALIDQSGRNQPMRTQISGLPWLLEGCPMTYFTISRLGSGYLAAWPTRGQVYFARIDGSGRVLPDGIVKTQGTTGMRNGILALGAADGMVLIAWKNNNVLGWQLYDANGQPQGAEESVDSPGGGAAGVVMADGRFVLFP